MNRPIPYLLTALLALLAAVCALALSNITPFGSATLAWQDNGQQVASDFGYVRGVWEGRHTLDWSYACGGSPRSSFHPTFNNLASPLTWAVAALPGLPALTRLSLLFLLQFTFLPLGALFYLRRRFPRLPVRLGMALALAYALGGFVLSMWSFLPFLNVAILFPWYLAALDALLHRGRWLPFCLLLAFMLAVGTYFAWMWLLFTAVYASARTGWHWHSPVRQHTRCLLLASAAALGLSAFSWLPSLLFTAGSARAGEAHFWWHATRVAVEGRVVAYLLSLPLLLAAVFEFRRFRLNRYHLALAVLLVGLTFISATTLWHLSRPWDFAGRFGYMVDFMFICLAAEAAQRSRRPWRYALLLVFIGGTLALASSLGLVNAPGSTSYQASAERVQIVEWAAQCVPAPEGRAKAQGHAAVENLAFFSPFDSLSHFTACITAEQESTLARWGYQQRTAVISTEGGTRASDTLLGMRYILSQDGNDAPYQVEENPWHYGLGLMVPANFSAPGEDAIARQQGWLSSLLGAERSGTRSCPLIGLPPDLPPDCLHYLLHEGKFCYEGHPYTRWGGVETPPALWELPPGAVVIANPGSPMLAGEASYSLYHLPYDTLKALKRYALELPVFTHYAGRRMSIFCRSTEARPVLFLPLLWQAGYRAEVDGEPVAVENREGFVGLAMPRVGEHEVELEYRAPGWQAGWGLTLLTLLALVQMGLRSRLNQRAEEGRWHNWPGEAFCRRLLLVVSWGLLLWPLVTLPVGVCW